MLSKSVAAGHDQSCTGISNTVREGVREEIVKIDVVLFRIGYQLKIAPKSLIKGNVWEILKLI